MAVDNYISIQLQKVRKKLPELQEMTTTALSLIKAGSEVEQISKQDYRMPFVDQNGGDYGVANFDGGNLGGGTGMKTNQLVQSYFGVKHAISMTLEEQWTTEKPGQAVLNAFKENMRRGMKEFLFYEDIGFHNITGNQGVIGVVASVAAVSGGKQVLTMNADFGSQLLRKGQPVEVFSSDFATHRTSSGTPENLPRVAAVDVIAKTVTLSNVVPGTNISGTGVAANDNICFQGVGTTPTYKQGLYYFNSTSTSGTMLGLDRTQFDINSNFLSASGNPLVPAHMLVLKHRILQRRGEVPELKGLTHPSQINTIAQTGVNMMTWMRSGGSSEKMLDIMPNIGNSVPFVGVELRVDIHQSRSRIDVINPKTWGRARLRDLDFLEIEGQRVFPLYGTVGLKAAVVWYLVQSENYYCIDPAQNGFISNLQIPSGY